MTESTARAERFEPHSPALPFFVWDAPQKPVSVRMSLDAIERLERDVVASFRSVSTRGSEIGGLLLGRVTPGPRPVVSVESYEPVPCDYSRGPLYRLSEKDLEGLDAACRRRAAGENDLVVVGTFRSHTRKDLALDHDDISIFAERFREPEKIFLLVKPFATKPAKAALFTREDGKIRETSQVEFPFTRAELVAANLVRAIAVNGASAAAAAPAPEPAPAAEAKPAARAQVVPIASRRETPAPVVAPEPEQREPEPAPEAALPAAQPEPEITAAPAFASLGENEPRSGRRIGKFVWIAGGLAVAALLMTLLIYPGLLVHRGPSPAATNLDSSTLALRVERSAGQLLLTWNRESEAVRTATKAVLSISDGPQQENVQLDLAQLRNGSVVYSPVTSDVSFRLEVTSANQEKSISEHVRVLGTRPSAMAPAGEESAKKDTNKEEAETAAKEETQEEEETAQAEPATPRESLSAKWRQPESLGQRLRPATPSDLAAPPTLTRTGGISGGPGLPGALPGSPAPPAPAPPAPAAAARPASSPVKIGGHVQEAQVISRKDPVYPQLARQARVQGVVELEATVGEDGTVRNVKVLSGHPLLRPAAADAVKQWRYRPTLLNGEAVEVTTRVAVGFTLNN